jgi:autoinducer 2-degrading protein
MPVTYVIKFKVVPDRHEEFLERLHHVLDAMKHEPMYHAAVLHRDPGSDNTFLLYETWESHEDVLNVQLRRPYRQEWHAALPQLLEAPREIGIWEPIKADWRQPSSPVPAADRSVPAPSDSRSRPSDRRRETASPMRALPG